MLASLHVQIKRISVKEVTSPIIFDNLKNAVIGGLYDPAFGPMDPRETCRTCGLNSYECPGHFGHVEVSVPLYNPLVFMTLFKVLRTSCMHCFKFRMTDYEMGQFCERFELLRGGELVEAMVRCVVVRISQLVSRISYLASRISHLRRCPPPGIGSFKRHVVREHVIGFTSAVVSLTRSHARSCW